MIDAAREAFLQGLHLTAAISTVGTIGLAVFVAVLLRRVRGGSEAAEEPDVGPGGPSGAPADTVMEAATVES